MHKGKKYVDSAKTIDRTKQYDPAEALSTVVSTAKAKFDETIELHVKLGVDSRHADQQVRVAVFAKGAKADEALAAGADIVGAEDLMERIQKENFFEFDVVIATPDMMGVVGRLGRVLGPKGLMPNPKVGTVTPNVAQAVKNAKAGQVQFRADKAGIIHAPIGRASFTADRLQKNLVALIDQLNKLKPASSKGQYLRKVAVSSTMGIGVRVDIGSINN